MPKKRVLEWDKEGDGKRVVRFHKELPSTVQLTGTPVVRVEKLTPNTDPADWNIETSVVVTGISVVDAVDDDETTILGTNQAVEFTLNKDTASLPDETDDPVPGAIYRVVIIADRDDGSDVVGKVDLTIFP